MKLDRRSLGITISSPKKHQSAFLSSSLASTSFLTKSAIINLQSSLPSGLIETGTKLEQMRIA